MSLAAAAAHDRPPARVPLLIAMSRSGRYLAVGQPGGIRIFDVEGDRDPLDITGPEADFCWIGDRLWLATPDRLRVLDASGEEIASAAIAGDRIHPAPRGDVAAIGGQLVTLEASVLTRRSLELGDRESLVGFLGGVRTLRSDAGCLVVADPGRELHRVRLPTPGPIIGEIVSAAPIFDGSAVAVQTAIDGGRVIDVLKIPGGQVSWLNRIELPGANRIAIAPASGRAVATTDSGEIITADLRLGRLSARLESPLPGCSLDLDEAGEHVGIAARRSDGGVSVFRVNYGDLRDGLALETAEPEPAPAPATSARSLPLRPVVTPRAFAAADGIGLEVADVDSLRPIGGRSALSASERREILDAEIAVWRLRLGNEVMRRTEPRDGPGAPGILALARDALRREPDAPVVAELVADLEEAEATRDELRLLWGEATPRRELARRFSLGGPELDALVLAMSPAIDESMSRLFAMVGDRSGWANAAVVRNLVPDADIDRLVALGLLRRGDGPESLARLVAANAVVELFRDAHASYRDAAPEPEQLYIPKAAWSDLRAALRETNPRLVIRGSVGRGRRQFARFVASMAENRIREIDGTDPERLADSLCAARIKGEIPCAFNVAAEYAWLLDQTEGPLIACVDNDGAIPLDAPVVALPELSDAQRQALWTRLLGPDNERAAAALANRYRVPPATVAAVVTRSGRCPDAIDRALRQSLAEKLRSLADAVTDLPGWDDVILPDDIAGSIRELIARRQHFAAVRDGWGLSRTLRSCQGVVALFSGAPGTGKSLAAGLIARELERDLYRIDLSKMISKWIGETEKNLAALFDAAEQADAVLLFDEADSLFARRSAVKSSNDRYANQEVNYLLQRLDSFRGVAILTSNHGSAIDKAFRRRLTAQLIFPFPDVETRAKLWQTHMPRSAPTAGAIDVEELARRFELAGGHIRNAVARAAFLAASEGVQLAQEHFERAVALEYSERGRLSTTGRLDG